MNTTLIAAKTAKKDEFYTRYEDIEAELKHYPDQFRGKVVYSNCDDWRKSQFVKYFHDHFHELGLKKYIATCYAPISFLDKWCPEQFEIVGNEDTLNITKGRCYLNGKRLYAKILIKRR